MSEQMDVNDTRTSLLRISNLRVKYKTFRGELIALNGLNLDIRSSEILAVVGESGCGKSTLGLSLIRLLPTPPAEFASGEIMYNGKNVISLKESEMTVLRGTSISMIFQEPMSSLDPVYTVGDQIMEVIAVREGRRKRRPFRVYSKEERTLPNMQQNVVSKAFGSLPTRRLRKVHATEAVDALKSVQIADPERVIDKYPHELSGGIAQRVMIAQALIQKPSILIADEPTSALDVTTQAQVLSLIRNLRDEIGSSILFITHDLAVAAQIADRVAVMYAGEIVEVADVQEIFKDPLHPYTEALIKCFPDKFKSEEKLDAIPGEFPDIRNPPSGCLFHPRCKYAFQKCNSEHPSLVEVKQGHRAACFLRY